MQTISFDIQKNLKNTLDISEFFKISEVQAISAWNLKPIIDPISSEKNDIILYKKKELEIEPFFSFGTLDLIHPLLLEESDFFKKRIHKQNISLIHSLNKPFWAIDIRKWEILPNHQKYSDIFIRKLSYRLKLKRFFREWKFFWRRHHKKIIWAVTLIFVTVLPLVFFIKFSIESGYNRLLALWQAQNLSEWNDMISSSKKDFERAEFLLTPFSWIPLDIVDTVNRATTGGKNISSAMAIFTDIINQNSGNFSLKIQENFENSAYRSASKDIFPLENSGIPLPTNMLVERKNEIFKAIEYLQNASEIYKNSHANNSYAEKMQKAWNMLEKIMPIFAVYKNSHHEILTMLGHNSPQRYMIFNQNRDEIRANGGFPGSIISFTLYKGNILDYRTDDVYYYDWNLYPHQETPPPGIALLTDNYGLRDVNYYPDFQKTLQKANNFVERSGDSTLTTAIVIHQGLIEEILSVIGEVRLDGVDVAFDENNFSVLMSMLVENKFAKEKTPKDILFRFIDAFGKKIIESKKFEEIAKIIENHWTRWEILIASRNDATQKFIKSLSKPLAWESNSQNWIYPIFTSVSGNKSDRYIQRKISTEIIKQENCNYKTTVSLTHEHTHSQADAEILENFMQIFELKDEKEQDKMRFIQGAGDNKNFVRFYVPKWAKLLSWDAEVSEDENATIFSFMLNTSRGKISTKTLSYEQNILQCENYDEKIEIFRQPWLRNDF